MRIRELFNARNRRTMMVLAIVGAAVKLTTIAVAAWFAWRAAGG